MTPARIHHRLNVFDVFLDDLPEVGDVLTLDEGELWARKVTVTEIEHVKELCSSHVVGVIVHAD